MPPRFNSLAELRARRADTDRWRPFVLQALARHGLRVPSAPLTPGLNATYPTFVWGEVVVKIFGGCPAWRTAFRSERATLSALAADPQLRAPRLIGSGWLGEGPERTWPYLIMTRVPGVPLQEARLTPTQLERVAADVGRQVARVQALSPADLPTRARWPATDATAGAARSSLPAHLVAQVDGFLANLPPAGAIAVHGDLTQTHAFVLDGRLSGIIDWGDALVTDPHYELIQVARALLDCDRNLLEVFLQAAGWSRGPAFAQQALGWGLRRQALGLVQHYGMDVFEPIAARYALEAVETLEELAELVFDV